MRTATHDETAKCAIAADGTTVSIRAVTPADDTGLADLYGGCSDQSRYLRFHAHRRGLRTGEAAYLAAADGRQRIALVATAADRLVADARVEPLGGGDGEAAVLVADDAQRGGLGGALLTRLTDRATTAGYRRLLLHILPENTGMLRLAGRFGATPVSTDGRAVTFVIPLPLSGRFGS
jgi:GNAT superfamily N-acetyltransferase